VSQLLVPEPGNYVSEQYTPTQGRHEEIPVCHYLRERIEMGNRKKKDVEPGNE
jgi:hypothetical protein